MANNKSAKKRILRLLKRNRLENRKFYKTSVRTLTKTFLGSLEELQNSSNTSENKEKVHKVF